MVLLATARLVTVHDRRTDHAVVQRRTLRLLVLAVVPAGIGVTGSFSSAALLGEDLTGAAALGTLAASCVTTGGALSTVPLAQRMARAGRRAGLVRGWSVGAAGSALAAAAAITGLYPLLLLGSLGVGVGQAAGLAARFAAADLADDDGRARAIGLLVWASSLGAVFGPTVGLGAVGRAAEAAGLPALAGPNLLSAVVFVGAAGLVHRWLRPDPLEVLGALRPAAPRTGALVALKERIGEAAGPVRAIAASPTARLAAGGMVVGQAVMTGVMTATPLHMRSGAHELQVVGFVISVHIIGMYVFAPVVGWAVDRIGPRAVLALGGVALFVGGEMASHTRAEDSMGVFVGLFLIGIGWSCGLVAGSTMLTAAFPPLERVGVQGAADLLVSGAGALASLSAGVIYQLSSYANLSHLAGLLALTITVAALASILTGARRRSAPTG